ncbi:MAG: hypothetical protein IPK85_08365 [Gemmatimonadetes bacterium]|nr:hypothetical protein [Gemmatimonadota bacterium]
MTRFHDRPRPRGRVGEPAQVYLTEADQARLERLTARLGASKSDVLRQGLEALELQHLDPSAHPTLRVIGLVDDVATSDASDVAREHDRVLAESEEQSWQAQPDGDR